MNIYNKKTKDALIKQLSVITAFLMLLCFVSADYSSAAEQMQDSPIHDKPGFYYTIQKGDTLWDLSQKFYNSNWVWPGLWSINKEIKNPHLIYPGEKIQIFLKDRLKKTTPVKYTEKIHKNPKIQKIIPTFYYPVMDSLGFIKQRALKPIGQVINSRDNKIMISQSDIIYVERLGHRAMTPGKKYTVFTTEKISFKYHGQKFKGIKHIIKGIIKILKNNGQYTTAKVIRSFHYISEGDLIMHYEQKTGEIKIKDALQNINANLICSENKNALISENNIAFINRGSSSRIKPGQIYGIFRNRKSVKSSMSKKKIILAPLKIGSLIVLKAEKTASTVFILSSQKVISPGDLVRFSL